MVNRWRISPLGIGFALDVTDAQGENQAVQPTNSDGDPIQTVRAFAATYAKVGDLIVEPDRVYQVQPPIQGV